jgi:hypothetical protein
MFISKPDGVTAMHKRDKLGLPHILFVTAKPGTWKS